MFETMNINIIIIITILIERQNEERKSLRIKIEKYLHHVNIVNDSKNLQLLRQIVVFLTLQVS